MNLKCLFKLIFVFCFSLQVSLSFTMINKDIEESNVLPEIESNGVLSKQSRSNKQSGLSKSGYLDKLDGLTSDSIDVESGTFCEKNKKEEFLDFSSAVEKDFKNIENFPLTAQEFTRVAKEFVCVSKKFIANKFIDTKGQDPVKFFTEITKKNNTCIFGQKIVQESDFQVSINSDIHGDVTSLIAYLNDLRDKKYLDKDTFKIIKKDFYLVLLGDYVDRGEDSSKVLYLLMRLKIANPEQVILLRGNHENTWVNLSMNQNNLEEVEDKLYASIVGNNDISLIYNMMPAFLFLGKKKDSHIKYMLFTHGGLEPRFNPHILLSSAKKCAFQVIDELDLEWLKDNKYYDDFKKINEFQFCRREFAYLRSLATTKGIKLDPKELENMVQEKSKDIFLDEMQKSLLLIELLRKKLENSNINFDSEDVKKNVKSLVFKHFFGFISNYFNEGNSVDKRDGGGCISFGKDVALSLLNAYGSKDYSIVSVFRGHQHGDMNDLLCDEKNLGIYNSWRKDCVNESVVINNEKVFKLSTEYPVWTLNSSPNIGYNAVFYCIMKKIKHYNYDTYAILNVEGDFDNWTLRSFNLQTYKF